MGKKKVKKVSVKKERYAKFRKDKPGTLDLNFPNLTEDQQKWKREDEKKIDWFARKPKNQPPKDIVERKSKSKR